MKERGQSSPDLMLPHLMQSCPERTRDFLATFGNGSPDDYTKVRHLIYDLEHCCQLEWELKQSKLGRKAKGCNFPKFQLKRWETLPTSGKLMLASFVCLHMEGLFSSTLVKLVADILAKETWPDNPPLIEAYELCELPQHYLLSFLMFLRDLGLEEDETTPGKDQILKIWRSLNIEYLVKTLSSTRDPLLNRSTSMEMTEPLLEDITDEVQSNRELVSVFCLSVLVRLGVAKYFIHNLDNEYKGRGAASPSYDPSMLVNMLRCAKMNFEVLTRLIRANTTTSLQSSVSVSQDQPSSMAQANSIQTTDPNVHRESITINPFVSDVYPVSHFYKKPMSFSQTSESHGTGNVSSIRLVQEDFRSPGMSLYIGNSTQTTGRRHTNSDFRLKKKAVGPQSKPFQRESLPNVLRPSASYVTPTRTSRSSSRVMASNPPPIVKRELQLPSQLISDGRNPEIYSADNAAKPKFIMSSASKLPKAEADWRPVQDPPPVYFKSPPNHASVAVSSLLKTKTSSLFRASQSSLKSHTETLPSPRSQTEEAKTAKANTFLTSVAVPPTLRTENPEPEEKSVDTIQLPSPEWTSISGTEAKERVRKEVRWFGVPQKVQYMVTDDMSEYLKTSNYYEEHRDQFKAYPKSRKKSKVKLGVFGKTTAHTRNSQTLIKDSLHYLRVYNNEGIPWAPQSLIPTFKVRQDTFCQNYGELLVNSM